jgi:hypothetical protein
MVKRGLAAGTLAIVGLELGWTPFEICQLLSVLPVSGVPRDHYT